jgi:4-amino-4-deoxy-L-arabinose transferase-like glycosyltransferase
MAKGIAIDGAYYGFMARDFLEGNFAKGLSQPFHPFYPLLIYLISPDTALVETAGRFVSLFFGTLTLIPLYYLVKEAVGEKEAVLAALFYSFHPYLVPHSGMLLSEATYWGLLTLSIYLFWIGLKGRRAFELLTSGAFLGMAYLTRPEGLGYLIAFLIWVVIYGGIKEGWFRKIVLLGGMVVVFSIFFIPYVLYIHQETGRWLISKKAVEAQVRYLSLGKDTENQGKAKATRRPLRLPPWLRRIVSNLPFTAYAYLRAYHVTLWIFLFLGLIRTVRHRRRDELFLASLVLLHLVSLAAVGPSTVRFSVPVVAFSLFWAGAGVGEFMRILERLKIRKAGEWVVLLVVVVILIQLSQALRPEGRHREEQRETGIWLKQNTSEGATIMSNSPQEAFYADREFIPLPAHRPAPETPGVVYKEVMDFARKNRVGYIVVNGNTKDHNPDFFESIRSTELKERYRYVDQSGNSTIVYELVY